MFLRFIIPIVVLCGLAGCSGKSDQLVTDLDRCLMSCDSTTYTLEKDITKETLSELIQQSAILRNESENRWQQSDTLDLETALKLDAFQAAFANSVQLEQEYNICLKQAAIQQKRIRLLKADIEEGRGERSGYARNVALEKKELTKIRTHCNDIRLRFEELKTAVEELASILNSDTVQP